MEKTLPTSSSPGVHGAALAPPCQLPRSGRGKGAVPARTAQPGLVAEPRTDGESGAASPREAATAPGRVCPGRRGGPGRLPARAPLRAVLLAALFFQEPCRFRYIHSRTMGLNTNRYHPN